jgi:hypothetical protein
MRVVPLGGLALLAACAGPGSFGATATELGVVVQSAKIEGRDGAPSGLAWGHSVFTFGDTVMNVNDEEGTNWHNNSYAISDAHSAQLDLGFYERLDSAGAPRYFVAPTADEDAFNVAHRGSPCSTMPCGARWAVWPGPPVWDAEGNRALIFYQLIYAEPGNFNFHGMGASVAVWSDFAGDPVRPELSPGADHPTLLFSQSEPAWGAAAALIDDGMLYAFSCSSGSSLSPSCYLARVAPASVLDRAAWRFWDGTGWSDSMDARRSLFEGAPGLTVARSAHLGSFAAIYAAPLTNDVLIRTASAISGPWSAPKLLFTARRHPVGAYDANWHVEYDDGSLLYVTFTRPNGQGPFGSELVLERAKLP